MRIECDRTFWRETYIQHFNGAIYMYICTSFFSHDDDERCRPCFFFFVWPITTRLLLRRNFSLHLFIHSYQIFVYRYIYMCIVYIDSLPHVCMMYLNLCYTANNIGTTTTTTTHTIGKHSTQEWNNLAVVYLYIIYYTYLYMPSFSHILYILVYVMPRTCLVYTQTHTFIFAQ